jgi:hypothetical protein
MSTVHYAIEILLDNNPCIAPVYDNPTYGIKDYAMRWITDRPSYDGVTVLPTWGANENYEGVVSSIWYEGFLTRDGISSNPTRSIDVTMSGNYGNMAGLGFTIRNDLHLLDYCETNNIPLINRRVNFYVIIDDVFYQSWSGVLSTTTINEESLVFDCQDDSQVVHKQIPSSVIAATEYPDSTNQGDSIPVCLGDVPKAILKNIVNLKTDPNTGLLTNSILLNISEYPQYGGGFVYKYFKIAAAISYDDSLFFSSGVVTLNLITLQGFHSAFPYFHLNELAGYYITVFGGDGRIYKIFSNSTTQSNYTTIITLKEKLAVDSTAFNSTNNYIFSGSNTGPKEGTFWFEIFNPDIEYRFSQIEDLVNIAGASPVLDSVGYPKIFSYDSTLNNYSNIGNIVELGAETKLSFLTNNVSDNGKVKTIILIPSDLDYLTNTSPLLNPKWGFFYLSPAPSSRMYLTETTPSVFVDADRITHVDPGYNTNHYHIAFDIHDIDLSKITSNDTVYVGIDFKQLYTTLQLDISAGFQYIDVFGKMVDIDLNSLAAGMTTNSVADTNLIPNNYYDLKNGSYVADVSSLFFDYNGATPINNFYSIPSEVISAIKDNGFGLRVWFRVFSHNSSAFSLRIKQVAIFAVRELDTIQGTIYGDIDGEKCGYYPDKTLNHYSSVYNPCVVTKTNDVYHSFVHILEDYDKLQNINYGNLSDERIITTDASTHWCVGRQLTTQSSSLDYLTDLAKQSFVGIFTNRKGNKALTAWLEDTTALLIHNQTSIIRDSIQNFTQTDVANLFNNFTLNYHYNPGANKFDRTISIKHTDESSFPAIDTVDPINPNGLLWQTYFSGPADFDYVTANDLWTVCHNAWLKNKMVQPADPSLTNCYWYNIDIFGYQDTAYYYFLQLINWTTVQKDIVDYAIPINADNLELDLLSPVNFSDPIYTNNTTRLGWVTKQEIDIRNNQILLSLVLNPSSVTTPNLIIEQGTPLNTDQIVERGTPTNIDTITEE